MTGWLHSSGKNFPVQSIYIGPQGSQARCRVCFSLPDMRPPCQLEGLCLAARREIGESNTLLHHSALFSITIGLFLLLQYFRGLRQPYDS